MPAAMMNRPSKKRPVSAEARGVDEPKSPAGNQHQADEDAALVAELPARSSRRESPSESKPGNWRTARDRLLLVDVERILKMLVENVNHPVAETPQQETAK